MKTAKYGGLPPSFISFIILFTCACTTFFVIGNAFCKEEYPNAATSVKTNDPITIIIDAGHGGEDGGTVGVDGTIEKDINLSISFILHDLFTASGYDVVMTRTQDIMLYDRNTDFKGRKKALDLSTRVKMAKEHDNAIFISIHMNSFPDPKYSGLQVYYSKNSSDSSLLAKNVQEEVRLLLQEDNEREIKPAGSSIFVLDRLNIPAILIECGFLSNPGECARLADNSYQKKLALSIYLASIKYLESP